MNELPVPARSLHDPSRSTVGILRCGATPPSLAGGFEAYDGMVRRLLGPGRTTVTFDVQAGEWPAAPESCAAYVLTGSPAGVYEDLPWIAPLLGFLREAKGRAKLVGLCFGHQAMAAAFGGEVIKSPKGWGIGLHRYDVIARAPWMDDPAHVELPASHQDQVVRAPPGTRVTLASDFTPLAGLDYGDAISFQPHPEFEPDYAKALIGTRRGTYGAAAAPALASLDRPDDRARVGRWIGRFLDG